MQKVLFNEFNDAQAMKICYFVFHLFMTNILRLPPTVDRCISIMMIPHDYCTYELRFKSISVGYEISKMQ